MTLVDSLDSILMLYAYAPIGKDDKEGRFTIFYDAATEAESSPMIMDQEAELIVPILESGVNDDPVDAEPAKKGDILESVDQALSRPLSSSLEAGRRISPTQTEDRKDDYVLRRQLAAKASTMSSLSISLTLLSIIVAFW